MIRDDFIKLTELRIKEAEILLHNSCYDGAYYLAGYALECALKACIASMTREHDFPDRKLVNESYTHDLTKLVVVAELKVNLDRELTANARFNRHWSIAKDWSEEARYRHGISEGTARDILTAITDPTDGVLTWVRKSW